MRSGPSQSNTSAARQCRASRRNPDEALRSIGYEPWFGANGRISYERRDAKGQPTHPIHFVAYSGLAWRSQLAFRDALRASSSDRIRSDETRAFSEVGGARLVLLGALSIGLLSLGNAILLHEFWPFLVAVFWGIALGLFSFTQLVFSARA